MNKHKRLLFALAAATALTVMPLAGLSSLGFDNPVVGITPANAAATVNIDVFFDPLAPMGQWVKHPQYNYVFCPKVDADWRPYSRGHWVYMNNYGWYFAVGRAVRLGGLSLWPLVPGRQGRLVLGAGQCLGRRLGRLAQEQRHGRLGAAPA